MLEINPNILLFQHHPRLKTYIHSPIEQAINESLQTVQRSLKVATSAAETIVRKDFLLNPDEQQLRTSARNMVAYLSSGLVLITARPALQDQIQSYIKTHFQTVLGVPQGPNNGSDPPPPAPPPPAPPSNNTEQLSSQTREMIQQAATEIAAANIELCCCLLQRITIHRAIQLIDQRLANDIEIRQRCRVEGRQLPTASNGSEVQSDRLLESIRLRYGPLSSHQLAIYEDFVHFIPGFKPSDNEKREPGPVSLFSSSILTARCLSSVGRKWPVGLGSLHQRTGTNHSNAKQSIVGQWASTFIRMCQCSSNESSPSDLVECSSSRVEQCLESDHLQSLGTLHRSKSKSRWRESRTIQERSHECLETARRSSSTHVSDQQTVDQVLVGMSE